MKVCKRISKTVLVWFPARLFFFTFKKKSLLTKKCKYWTFLYRKMERTRSYVRFLCWEAFPEDAESPHSTSNCAKSCRSCRIPRHEPLRKGNQTIKNIFWTLRWRKRADETVSLSFILLLLVLVSKITL